MAFTYPETKRIEHVDDYHGTQVSDPYRWLEESAHTPEVRAWIEAQNKLTLRHLETLPAREKIAERLTELWDYPKNGAPFKKGGRYFQFRNSGLQNQSVLYVMEALGDEGRVLLDPNTLSEDGTAALNTTSLSKDGRYLAYAVSQSGSDWVTWHVRDVATGGDLEDRLEWSRFSTAAWLPDSSGFYYKRYPTPDEGEAYVAELSNAQLMFHKLSTAQSRDEVIYERPDEPQWSFHPQISDDGNYLILSVTRGTEQRNLVYYQKLGEATFHELISNWEARYLFLGNDAETFYFQTDLDADRQRVIAIDINQPSKAQWRTLIPEKEDTLQYVQMSGDEFVCLYLQDASHRLHRFDNRGEFISEIDLPALGSIAALNAERDDNEIFYSFTSFLYPTTSYVYSLEVGKSNPLDTHQLTFTPESYETHQVFVASKDGTKVPMFLVHKKGLKADGQNPTLLYGYGGFNISLTPSFSPSRLAWLELGGIIAIANLRGGGEYGKAWHEAGTLERKQNVFDDFIACAEYLIDEKLTSPKKLAIQGGSNGGLLVGAAMTQRPELFGAAIPEVGVLDMLRFHKFTIGWAWTSDYGSADDPEQFRTLLAYSPLHNLKEGEHYPATLITTGDFDDRVVPAHSFKFAAALQAAHGDDTPVLIRIQTKAGHGMGKPTKMLIDEQADIWAFLTEALEVST